MKYNPHLPLPSSLPSLLSGDHIQIGDQEGTFNSSRLNSTRHVLLIAAGTGTTLKSLLKIIK